MGVLFDAFSYRVNKTPDGFYYDRWHYNPPFQNYNDFSGYFKVFP